MSVEIKKEGGVIFLSLTAVETYPVFKETRNGKIVSFGARNDYPNFLQRLFDSSTKHGSIIKRKVTYIVGKGWEKKDNVEDPIADSFIAKVNRHGESANNVLVKIVLDLEIFGGFYLQVIYNHVGKICELYHLDYTRMRSNADNTQFIYQQDWMNGRRMPDKQYPAFNPSNPRGSQILYVKEYRPGLRTYAMPGYLQGMDWINTDVEVGKHTYNNSRNGWTPSKAVTFIGGEPTEEEERVAIKTIEKGLSGSSGKKIIISWVNDASVKPIYEDLGASDLTKEDFEQVDKLIQGNVFSCHEITTPALFGVSTPGQLGQTQELQDGYEIFKNTYVNAKQQFIEEVFNNLACLAGVTAKLAITPTDPLGLQLDSATTSAVMTRDEVRERAGLKKEQLAEKSNAQIITDAINKMSPLVANKVLESLSKNEIRSLANLPPIPDGGSAPGVDVDVAQTSDSGPAINDNMKNMTPKQLQHVQRIVRDYAKERITREAAAMMLKQGFGMTDADVDVLLGPVDATGQQFSDDEDADLLVFAEYGEPRAGHSILKTRAALFPAFMKMADDTVTKLQSSILDLISKDEMVTPAVLAKTLKADLEDVMSALDTLQESGAIKVTGKEGEESRKLTAPLKELQDGVTAKTSAYQVRYSYEGPQDSRNRPFCAKLMELDRLYSRKDIEAISERLGYSVWDRRGGWYTVPGTDERRPYCRHIWMSNLVKVETK